MLNLISLGRNSGLTSWLDEMVKRDKDLKSKINRGAEEVGSSFRVYDLAGNPMVSRMLTGSVDIAFDLAGQAPHDVVPGAFIAIQGGALFCTPEGEPISELQISNAIMQPGKSSLKYVLASSDPYYRNLFRYCPLHRPHGVRGLPPRMVGVLGVSSTSVQDYGNGWAGSQLPKSANCPKSLEYCSFSQYT
jgi:hypothetical protein